MKSNKSHKGLKSIFLVLLTMVMALSLQVSFIPIGSTINTVKAATKKPTLNAKSKTLKVGETYQLKVKNPGKGKWKWTSLAKKTASVNKNGLVTAKKTGVAYIYATYQQYCLSCKIKVVDQSKQATNNNNTSTNKTFNAKEAERKITLTPIGTANLYEVTSTYDIPTLVTIYYKILDTDGVIVDSSGIGSTVVVPWDKTYIKIPTCPDGYTIKESYEFVEYKGDFAKTENSWNQIKNALNIYSYDLDVTNDVNVKICLQNTSDKSVNIVNLNVLAYNKNNEIIGIGEVSGGNKKLEGEEKIYVNTHFLGSYKANDYSEFCSQISYLKLSLSN